MHLKNGDWVVVCDAGKYIVYENHGDTDRLDLRTVSFDSHDIPPTRELGTDKPGRFPSPNPQRTSAGRAAVGNTDWHDEEEKRFIETLAGRMDAWARAEPDRHFVLVADPRSMGIMRQALLQETLKRIGHSITGDYVHRPVEVIEKLIARV